MRKLRFTLTFFIVFSFSFDEAHADPLCGVLLSSSDQINAYGERHLDETGHFIAYLRALLDRGMIGDKQLSYLVLGLKRGEVLNPFQDEDGSASEIQGDGVQKFIDEGELDKDWLLEWAEQKLQERGRVQVARNDVREKTRGAYLSMEFHPVRGGSFEMGHKDKVKVDLTYPIEVMSTPVTQAQWVDIMGENPSRFAAGEHSIVVRRGGKSIQMQPDRPVEAVTWWSALIFANKLSEKRGFVPAYDLTDIIWTDGTRAGDGTLFSGRSSIKIHANGGVHDPYKGDIYYQAEGYRLPTEAEQEYLLRAGGAANGNFHFGNDESELKDYGWHKLNSEGKTHPVGALKPMILDGRSFYDLHGNVWEWGWDFLSSGLMGGKNPVGPETERARIYRGGAWSTNASYSHSGNRHAVPTDHRSDSIGFRLVRTIGGQ